MCYTFQKEKKTSNFGGRKKLRRITKRPHLLVIGIAFYIKRWTRNLEEEDA
jgi:hypothetical protein